MNNHVDADTLKLEDLRPLPPVVVEILRGLDASPRLLAHLVLVHDVAAHLLEALAETWPHLPIDAGAVHGRGGLTRRAVQEPRLCRSTWHSLCCTSRTFACKRMRRTLIWMCAVGSCCIAPQPLPSSAPEVMDGP